MQGGAVIEDLGHLDAHTRMLPAVHDREASAARRDEVVALVHLGQGLLDHPGGQAHDVGLADRPSAGLQQRLATAGVLHAHADLREDLQRIRVDPVERLTAQQVHCL